MVERNSFEWDNFCCMDKWLNTIFCFCRRSNFSRDGKQSWWQSPFFYKKKQQWPTSKSQITRAWHACQAARQFHFGTTVPKCTILRTMSWTEESSCQWTAHNRGQVCFRRTRCFGSRLSQPMSTMAWHKMECHNTLMAASANKAGGTSWSFCPAWRRPCVSQLTTWVRNIWLAQWKQWWWDLAHKKWICPTMLDNAKWTTFNVVTAYNSSRSWRPTSTSFPTWKRTIYVSWAWTSTQQWSSIHTVGTMTVCGILDMQSISRAFYYNGRTSMTMRRTISCTTQLCACAWTTWAWKVQASSQWKYKRWSSSSGSTIACTQTMWIDNWSHNVDTEATSNGSLTHKSKKEKPMMMTMAMMETTMMMMQWEERREGLAIRWTMPTMNSATTRWNYAATLCQIRHTPPTISHNESTNEDELQQWEAGQCTNLFVQNTIETSTSSWTKQCF